jgi:hypothetical protein
VVLAAGGDSLVVGRRPDGETGTRPCGVSRIIGAGPIDIGSGPLRAKPANSLADLARCWSAVGSPLGGGVGRCSISR